jgi:hypothetical protein
VTSPKGVFLYPRNLPHGYVNFLYNPPSKNDRAAQVKNPSHTERLSAMTDQNQLWLRSATEPGLRLALEFIDSKIAAIETLDENGPAVNGALAALNQLKGRIVRALGPPRE